MKMKIHNITTLPIINFVYENWVLQEMNRTKTNAEEMKHLVSIAGRKRDRMKNEDIIRIRNRNQQQ